MRRADGYFRPSSGGNGSDCRTRVSCLLSFNSVECESRYFFLRAPFPLRFVFLPDFFLSFLSDFLLWAFLSDFEDLAPFFFLPGFFFG